jgi:hypothetical protein
MVAPTMTMTTARRTIFQGFISLSSFLSRELAHTTDRGTGAIELQNSRAKNQAYRLMQLWSKFAGFEGES